MQRGTQLVTGWWWCSATGAGVDLWVCRCVHSLRSSRSECPALRWDLRCNAETAKFLRNGKFCCSLLIMKERM
jgi:hypothetical protein